MKRLAASLTMAVTLAACSSQPVESRNAPADPTDAPRTAISSGAGEDPAGRQMEGPATGGLIAEVSALTGDVSGLNVRVTDLNTVIDLPSDALFEFDKSELTPAATIELSKAAELIRRGAPGPIQVIGYTDGKGDDAYNQRLSEARARSVADWVGQQVGVRQRSFAVFGKGEAEPIAPNTTPEGKDDPEGRARNRRVEVVIPRAPRG